MESETRRRIFVDLMYAIVLGAAFPLLVDKGVEPGSVEFWGVLFLFLVVLEDYFLYETQIAPKQHVLTVSWLAIWALLTEIAILVIWYLSATFIIRDFTLFLVVFALFFLLKLIAGVPHLWGELRWTTFRYVGFLGNLTFLIPVVVAFALRCGGRAEAMGWWELGWLFVSWVGTVAGWWSIRWWWNKENAGPERAAGN